MIRGQAGQSIGAQMVDAGSGSAYAGSVTVYVTIDAGIQAIGTVGSGACTAEGNGYYTYLPSAAETDGALIAFTFIGSGAVPVTVQAATVTSQQAQLLVSSATSSSLTVMQLATAVLRRINVVQSGEDPTPEDAEDFLERFNDFIDSVCALERLLIYQIGRTTFTITSAKGTPTNPYTVGTGGDVDMVRPIFIDRVSYLNNAISPPLELPIQPLTEDGYQSIPQKTLTSTLPYAWWYNATLTSGLYGSLHLYMIPTQSNLQGVVYAASAVTRFGSLSDTIALPPGYNRFLRDGMALECWPEWRESVPVDPMLMSSAEKSKRNLKAANVRAAVLGFDGWGRGIYDIMSDRNY
jgi:hypothetical protein